MEILKTVFYAVMFVIISGVLISYFIIHFCGLYNILKHKIEVEAKLVRRRKYWGRASSIEYDYSYMYNGKVYLYSARYFRLIPIYKRNRVVGQSYKIYVNKYYEEFHKIKKQKRQKGFWKLCIAGGHQCMITLSEEIRKTIYCIIGLIMYIYFILAFLSK